ncbi:MAG: ribonuclease P protein component [Bacteroidota bacterium]
MRKYTFSKSERLKSTKTIEQLFKKGNSFAKYPLRLVWLKQEGELDAQVQVTFSVPKKKFKKAVDRNRIKRQMREVWRLNKHQLYEQLPKQSFAFMFIYTAKEPFPYLELEKSMKKIIHKFVKMSANG